MRVIALALFAVACVPETTELARGAVQIAAEPSAGSRGEPFVTEDGWTVRVETLVLQTTFGVRRDATYTGPDPRSTSINALFDGAKPKSVVVPALDPGAVSATVYFSVRTIGASRPSSTDSGVEPAIEARFNQAPDGPTSSALKVPTGPSFVVRARCEREGNVVMVEGALQVANLEGVEVPVVIQPNAVTTARVAIEVENLFGAGLVCGDRTLALETLHARAHRLVVGR